MRRHPKGLAAVIVVAAGLVAGCSAAPGSPQGTPAPAARQSSAGHDLASGQLLPIFSYLQTSGEAEAAEQATNILVARCMQGFGYNLPAVRLVTPEPPPMYRRYGVTSQAVASRWGYHLDPAGNLTVTPPPQPPMSQSERSVLLGTKSRIVRASYNPMTVTGRITVDGRLAPAGGCLGQAIRQLRGGGADHALPDQINEESFVKSQHNPAVASALRAWSQCMAAHGYRVANPIDAADGFNLETPGPSRAEIGMAATDVRCKQQTGVVRIWFAAERKLQEAAIKKNIVALTAIQRQLEQAQQAALAVIG